MTIGYVIDLSPRTPKASLTTRLKRVFQKTMNRFGLGTLVLAAAIPIHNSHAQTSSLPIFPGAVGFGTSR
jgi:hypothetical protein